MDIKQTFEKLKSAFTSDKKLAVLCAVGVLGVLLLVISEFRPSDGKKAEKKRVSLRRRIRRPTPRISKSG